MSCRSRIVYIGIDSPADLPPMIPYLQNLAQMYPVEALKFEIISPDISLDQLNGLISRYVNQGYNYIGLPSDARLLDEFITSKGGRRWPNVNFMVQYYGIPYESAPNVHFFTDVNTLSDESLVQRNLTQFTQGAGGVYVLYQGKGEPVSTRLANEARTALDDLGVQAIFYEIGAPGNQIDESAIEKAAEDISLSLPPRPSHSTVIHIINWPNSEKYTQAALKAGIFDLNRDWVTHASFQNEYYPEKTPLPVPLELGTIPVRGVPSQEAANIGMPLDLPQYYSFPYFLSYLDSYMWASHCGQTEGINDKQLKFDRDQTRITYWLANLSVAANQLILSVGPLKFNPRWFNEDARVVQRK